MMNYILKAIVIAIVLFSAVSCDKNVRKTLDVQTTSKTPSMYTPDELHKEKFYNKTIVVCQDGERVLVGIERESIQSLSNRRCKSYVRRFLAQKMNASITTKKGCVTRSVSNYTQSGQLVLFKNYSNFCGYGFRGLKINGIDVEKNIVAICKKGAAPQNLAKRSAKKVTSDKKSDFEEVIKVGYNGKYVLTVIKYKGHICIATKPVYGIAHAKKAIEDHVAEIFGNKAGKFLDSDKEGVMLNLGKIDSKDSIAFNYLKNLQKFHHSAAGTSSKK